MQNILTDQNEAIDKAVEQIENQCEIIQAMTGKREIQNLPQVQIWSQKATDWEKIDEWVIRFSVLILIWEAWYTLMNNIIHLTNYLYFSF